jgi:hypothetical protein
MGVVLMATERPPRISANKLGEYMVATPTRRRTIIANQKNPPAFKAARYAAVSGPVADFLTGGGADASVIANSVAKLHADHSGNANALLVRAGAAEALEKVLQIGPRLLPPGVVYLRPPVKPQALTIHGVTVSVQPDMIVQSERRGVMRAGALKLHYIKGDQSALTVKGAEYVATLLHQWLLQFGGSFGQPLPELSQSVDVFRASFVKAPASQSRRMDDLQAACEEIASRWPTL